MTLTNMFKNKHTKKKKDKSTIVMKQNKTLRYKQVKLKNQQFILFWLYNAAYHWSKSKEKSYNNFAVNFCTEKNESHYVCWKDKIK